AFRGDAWRQGRRFLRWLAAYYFRGGRREWLGVANGGVVNDERLGIVGILIGPVTEPVAHAVEAPHGGAKHHGGGVLAPHVVPVIAKMVAPAAVIPAVVVTVVIVGPVLPVLAAIISKLLPVFLSLIAILLALVQAALQILGAIGNVGLAILDAFL